MSDDGPRGSRRRESLIEATTAAFRRRRHGTGRIEPSPAWLDLSHADRDEAFVRQYQSRLLERAIDPDGLSSTVRAVLERLERTAS